MAELTELKNAQFKKALNSFNKALTESKTEFTRDAAIQRFEYSFELFWKVAKIFLAQKGLVVYSPKDCVRELGNLNIFQVEEVELALNMAQDRNLSVHTYDEKMADELYSRLAKYLELMRVFADQF